MGEETDRASTIAGRTSRGGAGGEIAAPAVETSPRPDRQARQGRAVYVISVAAELGGVHPQTLRIYERKGLLDPARTGGGSRRYSEADIGQLRRIQDLTAAGCNLEGVRRILALEAEVAKLREELRETRAQAIEAVEQTHRHYRRDILPFRPDRLPAHWRPLPQARSGRADHS
jgi:MerR family transcriptional regulator/heat shock protein HspR